MWCDSCREDVPGFASRAGGRYCCARCGTPMGGDFRDNTPSPEKRPESPAGIDLQEFASARASAPSAEPAPAAVAAPVIDVQPVQPTQAAPPQRSIPRADLNPPVEFDEWELDLEWKRLRGLVGTAGNYGHQYDAYQSPQQAEFFSHAPHAALAGPHIATTRRKRHAAAVEPEARPAPRRGQSWSLLAWSAVSLGLMGFVCGGVLLGWSYVAGRDELWSLGMPIAVAGQIGLLIGLVLQLERIWQGSRDTVDKLEQFDEQLHDLKQTTSLLGATHNSAAQAFYSHLSQGAHPQMLLADLKGQLDLLAVRMSEK